jgi:hypothetical protein
VALLVAMLGCYSWRAAPPAMETVIERCRPRAVRVTTTNGSSAIVRNPRLIGDTIIGLTDSGITRVPSSELESLEVERLSVLRTAALAAAHGIAVSGLIAGFIYILPHYRGF